MKRKSMTRAIVAILCLILAVSPLTGCKDESKNDDPETRVDFNAPTDRSGSVSVAPRNQGTYDGPPGTWAIYWYLCGTDLETKRGFASNDLEEMFQVTLPENVTVVVQTGGTAKWQNDLVSPDEIQRYIYKGNQLTLVDSQPLASMGDPDTLADFLEYCNEYYPAEKQALILWDHGGGSLRGIEHDEIFGNSMSLPGFKAAIEAVPAVSGMYEFVGMDACLMATIDVVDILEGDARFFIASEEVEPGIGWEYTGLFSALAADTTLDGGELGRAICDSYYEGCAAPGYEREITLSVIDMSRAGALLDAYDAVGNEALTLAADRQQSYLSEFGRAAYDSESYGNGRFGMVDLGHLVTNAGHLLPESGAALLNALDACVYYSVNGKYRSNASGLSCYYLFSEDSNSFKDYSQLDTSLPFKYFYEYAVRGEMSGNAVEYLNWLASQTGAPAPEPDTLQPTDGMGFSQHPVYVGADDRWHLDLGPEMASNLAAVFVNVMVYQPVEGYARVLGTSHNLISDWENGVFIEDFQDVWGHVGDPNDSDNLIDLYMEPIAFGHDGHIVYASPIMLNGEPYTLHIAYNDGEYEILGAVRDGESDTRMAGKETRILEIGDVIDAISYTYDPYTETAEDWESYYFEVFSVTVDENFDFFTLGVGIGYIWMTFEMIDYAGNIYYSDVCTIRVRNLVTERLPDGLPSGDVERPEGSIEVTSLYWDYVINPATGEYNYGYRALVDRETYSNLAAQAGTSPDGDSMTGGGYRQIQLISFTLDIEEYVLSDKVYLSGYVYTGQDQFRTHDIMFVVEDIVLVW